MSTLYKVSNTCVVAQRRATDPWRKNKSTIYPYVACTLQATRCGVQETRRAALEPLLIYSSLHTEIVEFATPPLVCIGFYSSSTKPKIKSVANLLLFMFRLKITPASSSHYLLYLILFIGCLIPRLHGTTVISVSFTSVFRTFPINYTFAKFSDF